MTTRRRSSIKESNREISGLRICRFCKVQVEPPKRTFCSPECVHQWKIRSNNKYLRSIIYERDLGICAACGVDTRYTKIDIENYRREIRRGASDELLLTYLKSQNMTLNESTRSLWHADHIIPVSKGGGESGLENFQTLCIKCHKLKSKNKP